MSAGLVLESNPVSSIVKSPPKKWRNWDILRFCGVGASGSTRAITHAVAFASEVPDELEGVRTMLGNMDVSEVAWPR